MRDSSFNYIALLHSTLANVFMHQSREWGTMAAVAWQQPPWFVVFFDWRVFCAWFVCKLNFPATIRFYCSHEQFIPPVAGSLTSNWLFQVNQKVKRYRICSQNPLGCDFVRIYTATHIHMILCKGISFAHHLKSFANYPSFFIYLYVLYNCGIVAQICSCTLKITMFICLSM